VKKEAEMNRFLFDRANYEPMYNCSMKTPDEWKEIGHSNVIIGVFYLVLGTCYEVRYSVVPF
jgi:hypothetical protein